MVELQPYGLDLAADFAREAARLHTAFDAEAVVLHHIGSTAVPGLASKPTIDILVVVESIHGFLARLPQVEQTGFDYRPKNALVGSSNHLFLRKVTDGKRSHHVHVVGACSPEIDDYRLFRDALRSDHSLAKRYGEVKVELARRQANDRMSYVNEKSSWVDNELAQLRIR